LKHIDDQKEAFEQNTRQFVRGVAANNVLLTGSRGTGKSSLIKACLNSYSARGLRLIEVDKADLVDLPDIVDLVAGRPERFIVFCDDLSFEAGEAGYKALKVALDGSVSAQSENVLIYATSNRRHLMPEYMAENLEAKHQDDGEIHPGERVEEKISLSERFGLWVSFYPFRQDDYLAIVAHWLASFGCGERDIEKARGDALRFALGGASFRPGAWHSRVTGRPPRPPRPRDESGRVDETAGNRAAQGAAKRLEVAVGVVVRRDGRVLLGQRVAGKPYAGWWEFPGGKIEAGETVAQALARELHEELGLVVRASHPWLIREFQYPHAHVRLHFRRIVGAWDDFSGEPQSREGQAFDWLSTDNPARTPLLPPLSRCSAGCDCRP
jgi:hypothetical protein